MNKKWWYRGFTLEVMYSTTALVLPYWAHITEFPRGCPDPIKRALYDYTFDEDNEDLAIKGLKSAIDRALSIYNKKTQNGKYAYVCE